MDIPSRAAAGNTHVCSSYNDLQQQSGSSRTSGIQPSPASAPAHLDVLAAAQPPEGPTVPLAGACEGDRLGRHVEAGGEGLSSKQHLEQTLL